jgi:hypothetical protein
MDNSDRAIVPEGKKKQANHPHWGTITLAILAILVSIFSYTESHRSRLLNEELNRPLVRVTTVDLNGPVMGKMDSKDQKQENSYTLYIRNRGKAFARDVKINYKAQLDDMRVGQGRLRFSDFKDATVNSEDIGDLAPEDDYPLTLWALVLKEPPSIPLGDFNVSMISLYIKGDISYTNPINNVRYKESFCFADAGTQGHFRRCSNGEPEEK